MNAFVPDPTLMLADRWQRGFPLVQRPFAELGPPEAEAIAMFKALSETGRLSRIGAVVRPQAAGASTLAALSVPDSELESAASIVSAEPYVNHNYQRDHRINLWFVVTAPDEAELAATLSRVEAATGREVLDLRLVEPYHIDLGFGLGTGTRSRSACRAERPATAAERRLLAVIEDGLPFVPEPYEAVARRLGTSGHEVRAGLAAMIEAGIVSRFGCVLRHRDIGFTANAMAVWDVADAEVDAIGRFLAMLHGVNLCYRRKRAPPRWPYNLYVMMHGRDESFVRRRIADAAAWAGLAGLPQALLFSRRCFLQRGARFSRAAA